jgi:hypothetical protein
MFPERRLVLSTLVLGTHVSKLHSASTLVLFSSASCSWDGGSRASAQLTLNVPRTFPERSLNVCFCSLNVSGCFGIFPEGVFVFPKGYNHPAYTPINDSEWHWIVATVDNATLEMRIYVDGVLDLAMSDVGWDSNGKTRYV